MSTVAAENKISEINRNLTKSLASLDNQTEKKSENFNYRELAWVKRDYTMVLVKDMDRSHVQNTLNWCIRNQHGPDSKKDGILYSDWITYFTARLFDPECQ